MNLVQSDITGTHMKVHKVKGTVMPGSQAIISDLIYSITTP